MRASVGRVALAMGVGLASLVLGAEPAAACSCGAGPAPTVDFTGTAVEDLGYSEETHAWLLEVADARLGVEEGEVRISMVVGESRNGDGSGGVNTCGMDDNLIVGETYDVTSIGLDNLSSCGSQVDGPRADVPVRGADDDGRLRDLFVIFGGGVLLLLLVGLLVVRTGRS